MGFMATLKLLEGKTVATVSEVPEVDEDGTEGVVNGFVVTCTDGTAVHVGINYEDVDMTATQV